MHGSFLKGGGQTVAEKQPRSRSRRSLYLGQVEVLECRKMPSAVAISLLRPVASDDWADTDGSNPVAVAVLNNDRAPHPIAGGAAATLIPASARYEFAAPWPGNRRPARWFDRLHGCRWIHRLRYVSLHRSR